jgi:hypothetical protein
MQQNNLQFCDIKTKKMVATLYFPGLTNGRGIYNSTKKTWTCRSCPADTEIICNLKHGIGHLVDHIHYKHPDQWSPLLQAQHKGIEPFFEKISSKAKTIYDHIELVVKLNLPLRIVDSIDYRRHVKHERICRSTLTTYIIKLSNATCQAIARELPDKFGMIIDGWTGADKVYYICIYGQYAIDGIPKRPLLAMCPPIDELSHSSHSHYQTIEETLKWYNKDISNLSYMISDNCSTMTSLANYLNVPFIGCASHKLNIAIRRYLGIHFPINSTSANNRTDKQKERCSLVKIVHEMSVDLRTTLKLASLRQTMGNLFVIPLIYQETRWLSIAAMFERFVLIYPHVIASDIEPDDFPTKNEIKKIKTLNEELQWLKFFVVKIQDDSTDIYQTQQWFNAILSKFGNEFEYLSRKNSELENGLANIISETPLTPEMTLALKDFEIPSVCEQIISNEQAANLSPPLQILEENLRKRKKLINYNIAWIRSITPTSCQAERLFSKAGISQSKLRCRMTSKLLEAKLILTENLGYWTNTYCEPFNTLRDSKGYNLVQSLFNASEDIEEPLNSQQIDDSPCGSDEESVNQRFLDDDESDYSDNIYNK